jgi:hypothetical protein
MLPCCWLGSSSLRPATTRCRWIRRDGTSVRTTCWETWFSLEDGIRPVTRRTSMPAGRIKYRCPAKHGGWECPMSGICNAGKEYGPPVLCPAGHHSDRACGVRDPVGDGPAVVRYLESDETHADCTGPVRQSQTGGSAALIDKRPRPRSYSNSRGVFDGPSRSTCYPEAGRGSCQTGPPPVQDRWGRQCGGGGLPAGITQLLPT